MSEVLTGIARETRSPSLLYNVAMLEAFQRSARKAVLPPGHQDTEREVVLFGGSFGKGLGTFFSDFDILDFTSHVPRPILWTENFVERMVDEFEELIFTDPKFASVRKYTTLSSQIVNKHDSYLERLRKPVLLKPEVKEDPFLKAFKRQGRQSALAERAGAKLTPKDLLPKGSNQQFFDLDLLSFTSDDLIIRLREPDGNHYLSLMLLLTSSVDINAYEVTAGNLRYHQERVVKTLKEIHEDPERYDRLDLLLQKSWNQYKYDVSSIQLIEEISKTRAGKVFPFHKMFGGDHFPSIEKLEEVLAA